MSFLHNFYGVLLLLALFHGCPSKSDGPGANFECPHSRCDQKTCRTTATECNVSCIKTISKADCLWQSSSSVVPETFTGKNVRKLGKENRTETQLLKNTRGTHRMPTEKTSRKKFSKTVEKARFSKLCKAGQQLPSLLQKFPVPRRSLG